MSDVRCVLTRQSPLPRLVGCLPQLNVLLSTYTTRSISSHKLVKNLTVFEISCGKSRVVVATLFLLLSPVAVLLDGLLLPAVLAGRAAQLHRAEEERQVAGLHHPPQPGHQDPGADLEAR